MLGDQRLDVLQSVGVQQHLAVAAVIKDGDRHPPGALTGDAPVAPLLDHRFDPVATGSRGPLHGGDRIQGLLTEPFHGGKPLFRGPEDGGFLGAPVVGVAVAIGLLLEQGPGGLQRLNDLGVGILEHIQARERPGLVGEVAGFVHRAEHRQAVLLAGVEVVDAVTRCGVHEACA